MDDISLQKAAIQQSNQNHPSFAQYCALDEYFFGYPKRGIAVIINNIEFDASTMQEKRIGAKHDTTRLQQMYTLLGFDVRTYINLTTTEMLTVLAKVAKEDHSQHDCFSCTISSHGSRDHTRIGDNEYVKADIVYGRDGIVRMRLITEIFTDVQCPTLIGKPRIFMVQACRGDNLCDSVKTATTSSGQYLHTSSATPNPLVPPMEHQPETYYMYQEIPLYTDFILAYSAPPGFSSFRRGTGSWFVTALCDIVCQHSDHLDFVTMLTRVNQLIISKYQCNTPRDKYFHRRQIVPWFASKLTKLIYFQPKPEDASRVVFV